VRARAGIPAAAIGGVIAGAGMLGGAAITAARQAVLRSSLPEATPSLGVDRACCSGMSAVSLGASEVRAGIADALLCGGFESLSNTPFLLPRTIRPTGDVMVEDPLLLRTPFVGGTIARYTSEEAVRAGVDRAAQDAWALGSHERYFAAERQGLFAFERFAVPSRAAGAKACTSDVPALQIDESPRPDTSAAQLARLAPVRDSATITAGNAPGLNDGAAFLLLGSDRLRAEYGIAPIAEIVASVRIAEGPTSGTRTPALAIRKLLSTCGLRPLQLDTLEINEAFAATPLVSTMLLADSDAGDAARLRAITNPHGGAVAIGHPMGASGARLVMTAIATLRRRGGGTAATAICGGFGQGEAVLIRVDS
jgi:acetyl-CoA C-acetyltransferase